MSDDTAEKVSHGACVNCGLRLVMNGHTPVHAEGPQATKGTCALDPYGRYHAKCKSIQCGVCYPAENDAERETWARCTKTLFGRCNDGRMKPWRGTDGHNGSEWFSTCDRCGYTP